MSALNRTRMRLPSFTAPTNLRAGLSSSCSAGTLAASSTIPNLVTGASNGAGAAYNASPMPSEKKGRYASLGRRSSLRRRTSNPFLSLTCSSGNDINKPGSDSERSTSRAASFSLSALSPVREQPALLPLRKSSEVRRTSSGVDALSSAAAAMRITVPESSIGSEISSSLGPTLSSASSLHSLASLWSDLSLEPTLEAECIPSKSKLSASLVPQDKQEVTIPMPESPIAHARRCARRASMFMQRSSEQYTFCARVPKGLSSEMVTIYIKRGYRLAVIADGWHLERDAHYKWEIAFTPEDVNLCAVHVLLDVSGSLTVTVPRRGYVSKSCALPIFL